MAWFEDTRLKHIYEEGIAIGVPSEDCAVIRRKLVLLLATRSSISRGIVGKPFKTSEGRTAVRILPNRAISFDWIEGVGALRMRLEK